MNKCKEIEESNRMGQTRDLFQKIGEIKGIFQAMMGMIKDRNVKDLTEAEETKKRWQEYTEELYKKVLMTWITTRVCSLTWSVKSSALGSIIMNKASGGDGIPVELFQILKDDNVKVLHSIRDQIWKTQQWPQDWKRSVFIPIPKKAQTTTQLHSSHTLVK